MLVPLTRRDVAYSGTFPAFPKIIKKGADFVDKSEILILVILVDYLKYLVVNESLGLLQQFSE